MQRRRVDVGAREFGMHTMKISCLLLCGGEEWGGEGVVVDLSGGDGIGGREKMGGGRGRRKGRGR